MRSSSSCLLRIICRKSLLRIFRRLGNKDLHKSQSLLEWCFGESIENNTIIEKTVKEFKVPVIRSEELKLMEMISRGSSCSGI